MTNAPERTAPKFLLLCGLIAISAGLVAVTDAAAHGGRGDGPAMFEKLDANADGNVTQEELTLHWQQRFTDADANGDGLLSAEELQARGSADRAERRGRRVERMIARHDTNDDGLLSLEEMQPDEGRGQRMFARFDTNEDGSISIEEFESAASHFGRHGRGHHKAPASE